MLSHAKNYAMFCFMAQKVESKFFHLLSSTLHTRFTTVSASDRLNNMIEVRTITPPNTLTSQRCYTDILLVIYSKSSHSMQSNTSVCNQVWNCRGGGGWGSTPLPVHIYRRPFLSENIGFKFQSLGKISNTSTSDPPPISFRTIPTLLQTTYMLSHRLLGTRDQSTVRLTPV